MLIEPDHPELRSAQQRERLGLARSSDSDEPRGEREEHLVLMRLLDEQDTRMPFSGVCTMVTWVETQGSAVERTRVRRLMRLMGLEAISPKPRLSLLGPTEQRYPDVLRGMSIERCHQVWSCDSTSIRLQRGFISLRAVQPVCAGLGNIHHAEDQLLLGGSLSDLARGNAGDLQQRPRGTVYEPRVHQSAQSSQLGWPRRVLDNMFVERLWRHVKEKEVYIKEYQSVPEARRNVCDSFAFSNHERFHHALDSRTPAQEDVKEADRTF